MEEKKEQKKLSYEELQKVAGDLSQQNQKMYYQIQQMQKGGETAEGASPGGTAGKVEPVFFAVGSVPHVGS